MNKLNMNDLYIYLFNKHTINVNGCYNFILLNISRIVACCLRAPYHRRLPKNGYYIIWLGSQEYYR